MTNNDRRQHLKNKRAEAEAAAAKKEKKEKTMKIGIVAGILVLSLVIAGVLIGLNSGGDEKSETKIQTTSLLEGIPQNGTVLGNPDAPVTIVEYADLRCPYCADLSRGGLQDLIEGPVRDGKVKIDFRHWAIIPGSADVARGMYAAAEQGRGWEFIKNFYNAQGDESGTVSVEEVRKIAEESGVKDMKKWDVDYSDPRWDEIMLKNEDQANSLNFSGTPSIAVIGPDGKLTATSLNYAATLNDFNRVIAENR